ncbi:MAG TPA: DivIVA domain-containing protein [Solirubrobacteraceae bacterium]
MKLDRQSIERHDFPLARKGYDQTAVDAHLRELAAALEDLRRHSPSAEDSLAAAASSQVQGILKAAEESAMNITQRASTDAHQVREEAERDAASTRERALAQADTYVQQVAHLTAELHERIEAIDRELTDLLAGLGEGVGRLLGDLRSAEAKMRESYEQAVAGSSTQVSGPGPAHRETDISASAPNEPQSQPHAPAQPKASSDVDGARLVALNMALSGDSREQTDRYLAENFDLPDRQRLLDEVYAAVK